MKKVNIDDFQREVDCVYDGEHYSVRDNGAIFRHPRADKRPRPNDNKWTFGKENSSNPYLHLSNVRIHRVMATAFHGEPADHKYVVDHIDTNCRNNHPENLRWLTRLENALKNPVTRKKIEYLCGSIEAFLENPSMLNDLQGEPNFKWMRSVTPEEAENCKVHMSLWANSNTKSKKSTATVNRKKSFEERVYKPLQKWEVGLDGEPGLDFSKTPWSAVYMWPGAPYFPCCPQELESDPLEEYFQNLKTGAVLSYSDHKDISYKLKILECVILKDKSSIMILSERTYSRWSIVAIKLDERSRHFIHFVLGSYSNKDEANKAMCDKKELIDYWSEGYGKAYDLLKT